MWFVCGDAWADSREHFDIALWFEKPYGIFSRCQLSNSRTHLKGIFWRLDVNGYIGMEKGVDNEY